MSKIDSLEERVSSLIRPLEEESNLDEKINGLFLHQQKQIEVNQADAMKKLQ